MLTKKEEVAKAILEETWKELEDPESWCQGYGHIFVNSNRKEQQCLSYALSNAFKVTCDDIQKWEKYYGNGGWFLATDLIHQNIPEEFNGAGIIAFNDDPKTTHEDVMLVVKKAINQLEEGE